MRLSLALLLCIVGLASAANYKLKYTFNTPTTDQCKRIDGVYDVKEPTAKLKLVGVRLVIVDKQDKGKIALTFGSHIKKDQDIKEGTTEVTAEMTTNAVTEPIIKSVTGNKGKYEVQLYVYVDTAGANSALDFGAPETLFPRKQGYAKVSATYNPYYGAPVKFSDIQVAVGGTVVVDFKHTNGGCGAKETSSNWIGQTGIYKLDHCDGIDCGGKDANRKNYMWTRMYYDPVDGYVQLGK